jgi:hypothetical protein
MKGFASVVDVEGTQERVGSFATACTCCIRSYSRIVERKVMGRGLRDIVVAADGTAASSVVLTASCWSRSAFELLDSHPLTKYSIRG